MILEFEKKLYPMSSLRNKKGQNDVLKHRRTKVKN